jgi:hypothetical protein
MRRRCVEGNSGFIARKGPTSPGGGLVVRVPGIGGAENGPYFPYSRSRGAFNGTLLSIAYVRKLLESSRKNAMQSLLPKGVAGSFPSSTVLGHTDRVGRLRARESRKGRLGGEPGER